MKSGCAATISCTSWKANVTFFKIHPLVQSQRLQKAIPALHWDSLRTLTAWRSVFWDRQGWGFVRAEIRTDALRISSFVLFTFSLLYGLHIYYTYFIILLYMRSKYPNFNFPHKKTQVLSFAALFLPCLGNHALNAIQIILTVPSIAQLPWACPKWLLPWQAWPPKP